MKSIKRRKLETQILNTSEVVEKATKKQLCQPPAILLSNRREATCSTHTAKKIVLLLKPFSRSTELQWVPKGMSCNHTTRSLSLPVQTWEMALAQLLAKQRGHKKWRWPTNRGDSTSMCGLPSRLITLFTITVDIHIIKRYPQLAYWPSLKTGCVKAKMYKKKRIKTIE